MNWAMVFSAWRLPSNTTKSGDLEKRLCPGFPGTHKPALGLLGFGIPFPGACSLGTHPCLSPTQAAMVPQCSWRWALHPLALLSRCDFWPSENMGPRYQVKVIRWWLWEASLPPALLSGNFFVTFLRANPRKTQCKDRCLVWAATQLHLPLWAQLQHLYFS